VDAVSTDAQSEATPDARPKPHFRQTAAIVAITAAIAGAGGAAIYAATDQPTDGRHGQWHPPGGPAGPGGPVGNALGPKPANNAGPNALPDQSLHGEFVTRDEGGGYRTVLTQTGTITAISPRSITARSADGYLQTYLIPAAAAQSAPPFEVNQRVTVRATRDGQVATVTNIGFAEPPSG
jgi:hypothetical protein